MNVRIFSLCILALCSCTNTKSHDSQIQVFCASSLAPVIQEMKLHWEKEHVEEIIISTASSGTLARQIENGAKADLYFSANEDWTKYLTNKLKLNYQPRDLASNSLAVVTPLDSEIACDDIISLFQLSANQDLRIAMGNPVHVPLGKYTKEVLENNGLTIETSSKLILTKDARSTLRLVEMGEADFGIVYQSDAISSRRTKVQFLIPQTAHSAITYQAIAVNQNNAAKEFLNYIVSPERREIWTKNGFSN